MQKYLEFLRTPGRYLTLFYGITLGLALILAFIAIYIHVHTTSGTLPVHAPQMVYSHGATPAQLSTQPIGSSTSTPLPDIPPTPNEKTPSVLGVTADELQGLQVNLWHPWTGTQETALQAILDEFNQTNPWGITVQTKAYEGFGRLDEAMESALLTNTQPDVIVDYGYQARHWDAMDGIQDLTPYINDPVWGLTDDEQADFYPAFWSEDIVKDNSTGQTRHLGIPFYRSAYVLFYNQSWGQELGFPNPPVTAEDFRVRACAAAHFVTQQGDKSRLGKGGWLITPQPGVMVGWIYAFGGGITNPEPPGYLFNTPETQKAFEYLKGLQSSGCAWMDSILEPQSEFANRQALFVVGSLFDNPAQKEAFKQAGNTDTWSILPFMSGNNTAVDTYGPSVITTRSSPARQLAAWLVTKWLVYPPNQAEWVSALETYPTRQSTQDYLDEATLDNSQWAQALKLLPEAQSEPSLASWSMMRWALEDLMAELFDTQFNADQIPSLLEKLDNTAAEIYDQVR